MCIVCINGKGDQSGIIKEMCELQEVTDVLPCLIHVELLHAVSGLRTSVSVTWQRTCCLDTTRCFLFLLDQTEPGLKDLYLWTGGGLLHDVGI